MRREFLIAFILLIAAASVWTNRFAQAVIGIPREAYASDWTAVFIIEHIRTSGEWPTRWDDLHDEYARIAVPEHYAWTFEELQTLINVNWDSSIDAIRESDSPLDNIQLTSGRQVSYNRDPDVVIHDFIHTGNAPSRFDTVSERRLNHPIPPRPRVGAFRLGKTNRSDRVIGSVVGLIASECMNREALLFVLFYCVQGVLLIDARFATLWRSDPLLAWLIWLASEERALEQTT